MSGTDAHRPFHVWIADHPELVVEHHDHTVNACPLTTGQPLPVAPGSGGCYADLDETIRLCACSLCSSRLTRGRYRRARCTAERAMLRAAVRGADVAELELLESRLHPRD